MKSLTVFDPAMCCNTGVCGPQVDPKLARFAGDLDWLKRRGVAVTRINLAHDPAAFAANDRVKAVLESAGVEGLPVILVGDDLAAAGRYPARDELADMAGVDGPSAAKGASQEAPARASGCCGGESPAGGGCC